MLEAAKISYSSTAFVQVMEPRNIISLAAFKGQGGVLNQALSITLPITPRRISVDGLSYLWSGPDAWLLIGSATPDIADKIRNIAAITDQSDGQSLFKVSGPFARAILSKLVPIDLHESAFAADAVALTIAAHIGVRLWREDDDFIVSCFRSFAGALLHALGEAAAEFEPRG